MPGGVYSSSLMNSHFAQEEEEGGEDEGAGAQRAEDEARHREEEQEKERVAKRETQRLLREQDGLVFSLAVLASEQVRAPLFLVRRELRGLNGREV